MSISKPVLQFDSVSEYYNFFLGDNNPEDKQKLPIPKDIVIASKMNIYNHSHIPGANIVAFTTENPFSATKRDSKFFNAFTVLKDMTFKHSVVSPIYGLSDDEMNEYFKFLLESLNSETEQRPINFF